MIALDNYLATHLRYTVWATRRTLTVIGQLSPEEFLRDLQVEYHSVGGTLEQMFRSDWHWYELLAGEPPGLSEPLDPDYYTEFGHLETDYHVILARFEQLASFLYDPELAAYFAQSQVYVPWLEARLPKWQGVLSAVNQNTHFRGQLFALMHLLGHQTTQTELAAYFVELEQPLSIADRPEKEPF